MNYTITLTTAQDQALSYVAASQQDWIDNAATERARIAIDEIVALTVQKCLDTDTAIPGSKDAMVTLAFAQGWVKTATQRNEESAAAMAEMQGA
tara:strand:- start:18 stop:299 length:282 start_codon:yes stop_codon:yes gene_type:complete